MKLLLAFLINFDDLINTKLKWSLGSIQVPEGGWSKASQGEKSKWRGFEVERTYSNTGEGGGRANGRQRPVGHDGGVLREEREEPDTQMKHPGVGRRNIWLYSAPLSRGRFSLVDLLHFSYF